MIFDVYQTIIRVGPAPDDAENRWVGLWSASGELGACPTLDTFAADCREIVDGEHRRARAAGIAFPEVVWPEVILRAVPSLVKMEKSVLDRWIFDHQMCLRTVELAPGAATVLSELHRSGALFGIASNAQSYTLRELQSVMVTGSDGFELFDPRFCVWSFACGFSKPDPYFFRILSARLAHRGIAPHETLMVGDRMDNDILPARGLGWQTWHLSDRAEPSDGGSWLALGETLEKLNK
ncbi:MAG: HAD family hydrolase [Chthoniobacterales bacterium]